MIGDEDDDDEIIGSTEGQGTEGSDPGGGDEEGDLPAEHPDAQEDDGEQEDQVDAAPAKPQTRGGARIERLANEAKEAKAKAEKAERELEEFRRQQWQRDQAVNEQQERERLALMTPDERADYRISQMERRAAQERQQDRLQTQATMDKVAYDAKATINPVYRKFQDEVEARFQDQLRKGQPVEREVILKFLLGERALNGAANSKGAKQAGKRVAAQKVAPGSGKGDTASNRGKAGDTPEKRLQGVFI